MLDLRSGKVCKTLIPKVAESIFDFLAVFNATNELELKQSELFERKTDKL